MEIDNLPSLKNFKKILSSCIAIELSVRVNEEHKQIVSDFISNTIAQTKIHTMFTKQGVEFISDSIFGNMVIREFMLSLTDVFFMEINGNIKADELGKPPKYKLMEIISTHIDNKIAKNNRATSDKNSDIEKQNAVYNFLYTNATPVKSLLEEHDWLILIVLIHLSFQEIAEVLSPFK